MDQVLCLTLSLLLSRSVVSDFVTPWTVVRQAPLSMDLPGKVLEWAATSFSRRDPGPGVEPGFLLCRWIVSHRTTWKDPPDF